MAYIFRIMLYYGLNYSQRELLILNVCFGTLILLIQGELNNYMMCDINCFLLAIISITS